MNFELFVDATCDLPQEYAAEKGIHLIYSHLFYDAGDGKPTEINPNTEPQHFYDLLEYATERNEKFSTSAPNIFEYEMAFRRALDAGKDVLYISMPSSMSSAYSNANAAINILKDEYPDMTLTAIDSGCMSLGYGLLIKHIVDAGMEKLDTIKSYVAYWQDRMAHIFTVTDFSHFAKSGRLKSTEYKLARMLGVYPYMRFAYDQNNEKRLFTDYKVKGRIKLYREMVAEIKSTIARPDDDVVIAYGDSRGSAEQLYAILKDELPEANIICGSEWRIGAAIGTHTGGTVLAVFFRTK